MLDTLTQSPPSPSSWEVGANCNFMIAAARLGLRVAPAGHLGVDVYGSFLEEVLQVRELRICGFGFEVFARFGFCM